MKITKLLTAGLAALAMAGVPAAADITVADAAPASPRISWQPCSDADFAGMDCGTLAVPVNWSRPGRTISLALVRRPAGDYGQRVGSMLLNDGSGGSSIEQLRFALRFGMPNTTLAKRFDLIAVDPRGVGHSSPLACDNRPQRAPGVTYFPTNEAQFQALVANNRALAAECGRQDGELLANMDMTSAARDMEAVRVGLGERQLNWYGIHYSTLLGRTYARMFPGRLRTMVADTVLDDSLPPVARLAGEISTAEDSFNRFAAWCHDTKDCALAGQDVAGLFDQLVARADHAPIPTKDPARSVTGEDIRTAIQDYLNIKSVMWPKLGAAIRHAIDGDATDFTVMQDKTVNRVQIQLASCLDTPLAATNFTEFTQLSQMAKQLSPHLGGAVQGWTSMAGCLGWPVAPRAVDSSPLRNAPPTLIVQSTHQSSAPYSWAFGLSAQLPGSVVLTHVGDDYSMYLISPCVISTVDKFTVQRQLPAPASVCTD